LVIAFAVYALLLLAFGKNPLSAYVDVLQSTLGSKYGFSEVLVKMIPLVLTAVAVAFPARVGLVNVGGEGQLYMGAWLATWGALTFDNWPAGLLLPLMLMLGFLGGGLWAMISGLLRAMGWMSEVISTLLMNYVAVLVVYLFVYGPWKEPESSNYPQSPEFVSAAILPSIGGTRVHLGLILAVAAVALFYLVLKKTRFGFEMRAIGGNPEAARRGGISVGWYVVIAMLIGGGIAGIAGFAEASGIQGRLRPGLSPNYGFMGFLVSWLAGHNPLTILIMSLLLAIIAAGADSLQISHGLPFSAVNILMALILFVVLARRPRRAQPA
jgi:simple sugar transport system permease protein